MGKVALLGVLLLLLGGGTAAFLWKKSASDDAGGPGGFRGGPVPVVVAEVAESPLAESIEAIGTARANESVDLTSKVTDTVRAVHFQDGDLVEEGQILVELTDTEEHALLAEARATAEEAEKQLERVQSLVERNAVTRERVDEQAAIAAAARARVESIKARLADRLITAPFGGMLGFRNISPGSLLSPGDVITTLDDIRTIKLDFSVPESFLSSLAEGQEVEARSVAFPDEMFRGQVTTIGSRVDPVTRSVTVRALIRNEDGRLRPGMLLTVELIRNRRSTATVPEEAIVPIDERAYVFTINGDGQATRVEVTTGRRQPGLVEILSGLEPGQQIITEGALKLRPGVPVRPVAPPPEVSG